MNWKTTSKNNLEFVQYDYEGLSNLIGQFVELYKVCEDKKLVDELLRRALLTNVYFYFSNNNSKT